MRSKPHPHRRGKSTGGTVGSGKMATQRGIREDSRRVQMMLVCLRNDFPFCTAMNEKSNSHLLEIRSQLPEEHKTQVLEGAVCKMIRKDPKD